MKMKPIIAGLITGAIVYFLNPVLIVLVDSLPYSAGLVGIIAKFGGIVLIWLLIWGLLKAITK